MTTATEPAISDFAHFTASFGGPGADATYDQLWRWSVQDKEAFWTAVTRYVEMEWDTEPYAVTDGTPMPTTRWFPGGRTNYVSQVFAQPRTGAAVVGHDETGMASSVSWAELEQQVRALTATLSTAGVKPGDRVVGYLPDRPEAVVAFLATASLGAVWAGCGSDLVGSAAMARLTQLEPTCLVAASGYRHRGRWIDRTPDVAALRAAMPSLQVTVLVGEGHPTDATTLSWNSAIGSAPSQPGRIAAPVESNHPLWVLFSSGTTGPPKGIVHSHAGVVAEHLKTLRLLFDLRAGDQFFWYTTLNWMMWNLRLGGLLCGATIHCFDGAPTPDALWRVAERGKVTHLGVSPAYLTASKDAGLDLARDFDLRALRTLGCTGSVLTTGIHMWVANELGPEVHVSSTTGGTDVVTGFAGGVPTLPSTPGEITARCLGVDMHAWSAAGEDLVDEVGELVVTGPMPSMPIAFWDDADGKRYRDAYFSVYPGVWRHGDWVTVTAHGAVVVHGRSDATLNRHGIRMGGADICEAAETVAAVAEAMVIGVEEDDGQYWMPIFVTLEDGAQATEVLHRQVLHAVRQRVSPRHVPDEVIVVPGIPHTHTGKKLEVPVKNLMRGRVDAIGVDAIDRPELIDVYLAIAEDRRRHRASTKEADQ